MKQTIGTAILAALACCCAAGAAAQNENEALKARPTHPLTFAVVGDWRCTVRAPRPQTARIDIRRAHPDGKLEGVYEGRDGAVRAPIGGGAGNLGLEGRIENSRLIITTPNRCTIDLAIRAHGLEGTGQCQTRPAVPVSCTK